MNIAIWILAGGTIGWAGHLFLRLNEERGRMVAMIIGAVGGVLGGQMIAPIFTAAAAVPGEFSRATLFFAIAAAATFVVAGNLVYKRWDM